MVYVFSNYFDVLGRCKQRKMDCIYKISPNYFVIGFYWHPYSRKLSLYSLCIKCYCILWYYGLIWHLEVFPIVEVQRHRCTINQSVNKKSIIQYKKRIFRFRYFNIDYTCKFCLIYYCSIDETNYNDIRWKIYQKKAFE